MIAACGSLALCLASAATAADWDLGDGHKMHFPQLPDLDGWDVHATTPTVADDWTCSQTGPVLAIHFWGSWEFGQAAPIHAFNIAIYSDDPVGPGGSDPANTFSKPDQVLWQRTIDDYGIVPIDPPTVQGWLDPFGGVWRHPDHSSFFQYNITNIPNPLLQVEGTTYWLSINALAASGRWGWKTADVDQYPAPYTGNHYLDDAVWMGPGTLWQEVFDPITFESLDMAFVITPEPASSALLVLGAVTVLRRRR
jgi:hypothetical protein